MQKMKIKEDEDEEEDLFLIWIDRPITAHFGDGAAVEGILRRYSKETILLESVDQDAVVFLQEVRFLSCAYADRAITRRGELW